MKKKILFITKDPILKKVSENNEDLDGRIESLLGYDSLDENKYEKKFSNLPRGGTKNFIGRLCHLLEIPFMKLVRIGITLEIYPTLRREIKSTDIIFCVTDGLGLGLLFWKKLGFVKSDIIVIMMGLPEKIKRFKRIPFIRLFISSLLKKASVILTLSDCASKKLINEMKLDHKLIKTFYCGTNINYWKLLPHIDKENFILSIGNDGNRDFKTLIKALPENVPLKIITKKQIEEENKKIEVLKKFFSNQEIKELHNKSLIEVIPSKKLAVESAGLSTALQAMACGAAVIISRCPAIEELFTEGEDCLFYEPQNPQDLNKKIKTLWENKDLREKIAANGRKKVLDNFTCQKMAEQLEKIIEDEKF